ncbi:MAG: undecaprenyldiphospho-muramoylpentapeptide beta-N-acetylglucosaminyltransferase [Defluviitaleaceae bacterium]|nr:undecaprenyldiphospho-muramoylpentapeptide beta-N-acetylglucosaminyltransferase [Defluviitaleaceae bacterium]
MKKIILTGGGTAGHVTPNIALFDALRQKGYDIAYIGGKNSMEESLLKNYKMRYYGISTGKLRRYFDVKNFTDPFRIVKGIGDALSVIRKEKPNIVFSKGGFVAVPVVLAARLAKVPVVVHESDISPGLANKLSVPFSNAVCVSFPQTADKFPKNKVFITGTPIRQNIKNGDKQRGLKLCGFENEKPVILVIGGSSGSIKINRSIRSSLDKILCCGNIIHICGKGNVDEKLFGKIGYAQFDYVTDELAHLFAAADVVVSRAGANAVNEFLELRKPSLLIPLGSSASRGDQILNARFFVENGYSKILYEDEMTPDELNLQIIDLVANRKNYILKMEQSVVSDGVSKIINVIEKYYKKQERSR